MNGIPPMNLKIWIDPFINEFGLGITNLLTVNLDEILKAVIVLSLP